MHHIIPSDKMPQGSGGSTELRHRAANSGDAERPIPQGRAVAEKMFAAFAKAEASGLHKTSKLVMKVEVSFAGLAVCLAHLNFLFSFR